jgi:mannosyltransferase OCH1-like enzyme
MHLFGGIYADLDLVPLSPVHQHLPILSASSPPPIHFAYVGHMSGDDFEHSIPNAFMASIPAGHPFWLKPLHFVQENLNSETHKYPEALTGPVALKSCVKAWEMEKEARLADNIFDELTVLENGRVCSLKFISPSVNHHLDLSLQLVGLPFHRPGELLTEPFHSK